jgi:anaphase-promoting complex subunit 5
MWEVNSLDALFDLFDRLGDLLARPREDATQEEPSGRIYLSQTSPLGALVRRARVEFVRLQFDDAIKLWSAFLAYRAPTAQWTKRLAGLASFGVDIVAADLGLDSSDGLYEVAYGRLAQEEDSGPNLSTDDLERLLDVQLDRLQRRCAATR